MSEREYEECLRKIKADNASKERKAKLKAEKNKYKSKIKIETSKLMAFYLFVLFNAILIFAMKAMWTFGDLSYLGVLISDIAAQVVVYIIYCMKAYHGKKQEEQIKLERERSQIDCEAAPNDDVDENAVG